MHCVASRSTLHFCGGQIPDPARQFSPPDGPDLPSIFQTLPGSSALQMDQIYPPFLWRADSRPARQFCPPDGSDLPSISVEGRFQTLLGSSALQIYPPFLWRADSKPY
ncbi:hypothetical protein Dimus_019696 [Dionaea muscipula]